MSIQITWRGHGTFSLDIGGTAVVVDPFFAGKNPAATLAVEDVPADFILQTHGHGDHIADTVPLAKRTGATVICVPEIGGWLNKQGLESIHGMNTGGGYHFPFGRVKMTPALHSSGLPDGTYGGDPIGFVITAESKHIYFAGDTALFSDMALIGKIGLDVAVLPIGDNYTMGPGDAVEAVKLLQPKVVIPCHYSTWPVIEVDAHAWAKLIESHTDAQPVVLGVDETYTL